MKVSVVTPSFNQGDFILRTLQSVARQSGAAIEHVVVDGGSTDATHDVLRQFDGTIRWTLGPDRGQADAVNKGMRATDGEIIGWLNSDDVYYPDAIATVAKFFADHPDVDVVYGRADHIDAFDRPLEDYPTEPFDVDRLVQTCFICQPAAFFRRRVIERHGLLDVTLPYCMDYEYWLRLGQAGARFAYLDVKLAGSRLHAAANTVSARVACHAAINDIVHGKVGTVPTTALWNYACAVADAKQDRAARPKRHAIVLVATALWAGWHWNRQLAPVAAMASAAILRKLMQGRLRYGN